MQNFVDALANEEQFQNRSQWVRNKSQIGGKHFWFEWCIVYYSSHPEHCHWPLPYNWDALYEEAKSEYVEIEERWDEDDGTHMCVCSQCELKRLHYVQNVRTKNILMIGSVCIHKFGFGTVTRDGYRTDIDGRFVQHDDEPIEYEEPTPRRRLAAPPRDRQLTREDPVTHQTTTTVPKRIPQANASEACCFFLFFILMALAAMVVLTGKKN